jgi:uncharacterized protein YbdZ (MbtH family)
MDTEVQYLVVLNHEEQYSIWPANRELPDGWNVEGFRGGREECLAHIDRVWTDMRPLSLRRQMDEWTRNPPPEPTPLPVDNTPPLVQRLSGDNHRVEVRTTVEDKTAYLRDRLEIGYLHVFFPDTRGGTEIGVKLDAETSNIALEQIAKGNDINLRGHLVLDDIAAVCQIRLHPSDLVGRGGLSALDD